MKQTDKRNLGFVSLMTFRKIFICTNVHSVKNRTERVKMLYRDERVEVVGQFFESSPSFNYDTHRRMPSGRFELALCRAFREAPLLASRLASFNPSSIKYFSFVYRYRESSSNRFWKMKCSARIGNLNRRNSTLTSRL